MTKFKINHIYQDGFGRDFKIVKFDSTPGRYFPLAALPLRSQKLLAKDIVLFTAAGLFWPHLKCVTDISPKNKLFDLILETERAA